MTTPRSRQRSPRPLAGPRGHPLADPGLLDHPGAGTGIRGTVGERGHPGGPRHPCPARRLPSRVDPRAGHRPPGTPLGRWALPMRPLGRDLAAAAGLAAAVVVSLVIVRVTASEPEPTPTPARVTTGDAAPAAAPWTTISAPTGTTAAPAVSTADPGSSSPAAPRQPPATLVLSSGAPVNPRLDRAPRTARPAPPAPAMPLP